MIALRKGLFGFWVLLAVLLAFYAAEVISPPTRCRAPYSQEFRAPAAEAGSAETCSYRECHEKAVGAPLVETRTGTRRQGNYSGSSYTHDIYETRSRPLCAQHVLYFQEESWPLTGWEHLTHPVVFLSFLVGTTLVLVFLGRRIWPYAGAPRPTHRLERSTPQRDQEPSPTGDDWSSS